jgi:hypothetical protein
MQLNHHPLFVFIKAKLTPFFAKIANPKEEVLPYFFTSRVISPKLIYLPVCTKL